MKFPRLSRKTWIAIGLVVLLVVLASWSVKEGFQSKAQLDRFGQKFSEVGNTPHFKSLDTMSSGLPENQKQGFRFKMTFPLIGVGYYGDIVGDDLQIKQSQLESMLNGTFPVDEVITIENQKRILVATGANTPSDAGAKQIADVAKSLYYVFARGQVYPSGDPQRDAEAQRQLNDPNDKVNKQWTEQEKQWLRTAAGMIFKIIPDTPAAPAVPSPSTPPSSATYSASCSKCSVINNQITCACDVLPK